MRSRRVFLILLVVSMVTIAFSKQALGVDYVDSFDSWPTPACKENDGVYSPDYTECNGSFIKKVSTNEVDAYPECRSGKCFRGIWPVNESSNKIVPKGGYWTPSRDRVFVRFYLKFGSDHLNGWPNQYKLMRFIDDSTASGDKNSTLLVNPGPNFYAGSFNISAPDRWGDSVCAVYPGHEWFVDNVEKWIKVEVYFKHNGPGVSNAECGIWVTGEDGVEYSSVDTGGEGYVDPGISHIAWLMGNVSSASNPFSGNRTIYVDDICFGDSLSDREGTCGQKSSGSNELGAPENLRVVK